MELITIQIRVTPEEIEKILACHGMNELLEQVQYINPSKIEAVLVRRAAKYIAEVIEREKEKNDDVQK